MKRSPLNRIETSYNFNIHLVREQMMKRWSIVAAALLIFAIVIAMTVTLAVTLSSGIDKNVTHTSLLITDNTVIYCSTIKPHTVLLS